VNLGGSGAVVTGGGDNVVRSCDIRGIGEAGIRLSGGDRATLAPCRNAAINNDVADVGRRRRSWAAAIQLGASYGQFASADAVGCRVARNLLHDLPHAAVLYGGNDNRIEGNEVCRVALTSSDVGAFYTRQDWTSHGNLLRHNLVHDCPRANAFYLDDGDSGDTVEENVVVRAACGPFIGGGHDNVVRHNVVVDCPLGIHIDARGVARGYATSPGYRGRVESIRSAPAWTERFPGVVRLLDPALDADGVVGRPHGNVISGNVTVGCRYPLRSYGKPREFGDTTIEGNLDLPADTQVFVAAAGGRLVLDPTGPVFRGQPPLPAIPLESMGLEIDAYRTTLPAAGLPAATPAAAEPAAAGFDSAVDVDATDRARGPSRGR